MIPQRIVAEISRNWDSCLRQRMQPEKPLLSQDFERVIEVNRKRGYALEEWKLYSMITPSGLNETIIAVFVQRRAGEVEPIVNVQAESKAHSNS